MKIYICVDSEGQAAITREKDPENVYGSWQAEYNRRRATDETIACVEAAHEAGADEIIVHDCGFIRGYSPGGLTLYFDELPRGIKIVMGGASLLSVIDESFDGVILLGHHAMAGTQNGVMAHTFSSAEIADMRLNGRSIGEIGVEALQFGKVGVPVIMVSGDDKTCDEAQQWLGDIEVAPVKQGLGNHQALSLHPKDADDLIHEKTIAAIERVGNFKPLVMAPPYELEVDLFTEDMARHRATLPLSEKVGPKTVVLRTDDVFDFTHQMTAAGTWSNLGVADEN
jgi:D-amino peptidase